MLHFQSPNDGPSRSESGQRALRVLSLFLGTWIYDEPDIIHITQPRARTHKVSPSQVAFLAETLRIFDEIADGGAVEGVEVAEEVVFIECTWAHTPPQE